MASAVVVKDGIELAASPTPKGEKRNTLRVPLSVTALQQSTALHSTALHSTALHSTAQHSASAHHNANAQHNALAQHKALAPLAEGAGMGAPVKDEGVGTASLDVAIEIPDAHDSAALPDAHDSAQRADHSSGGGSDCGGGGGSGCGSDCGGESTPTRPAKRVGFAAASAEASSRAPPQASSRVACKPSAGAEGGVAPITTTAPSVKFSRGSDGRIRTNGAMTDEDTERLVFFERMFFVLDSQARGFVSVEEAKHVRARACALAIGFGARPTAEADACTLRQPMSIFGQLASPTGPRPRARSRIKAGQLACSALCFDACVPSLPPLCSFYRSQLCS